MTTKLDNSIKHRLIHWVIEYCLSYYEESIDIDAFRLMVENTIKHMDFVEDFVSVNIAVASIEKSARKYKKCKCSYADMHSEVVAHIGKLLEANGVE